MASEIYQIPEGNGNAGFGNIPFSIPVGGFGGGTLCPFGGTKERKTHSLFGVK